MKKLKFGTAEYILPIFSQCRSSGRFKYTGAKLSKDQVSNIRQTAREEVLIANRRKGEIVTMLSKRYGVSETSIQNILYKRTWK